MLWSKKYLIARLRFNLTYGSYSFLYIFYVDNNGNSDFTATYNGPYVSLTLFSSRSHSLLQSLGKCTNWGKLKLALSLFQCAWQTIKKPIRSNAFIMSEYMKMHFIYPCEINSYVLFCLGDNTHFSHFPTPFSANMFTDSDISSWSDCQKHMRGENLLPLLIFVLLRGSNGLPQGPWREIIILSYILICFLKYGYWTEFSSDRNPESI